jgi:NADH-quinone oxidoreductase subunit J
MIAFIVVGAAAVAAAVGVITARQAVHSVLWLIVHLCALAVLYMTLQAPFLGLVQILLYAGAVMVLFMFVLGLLGARSHPEGLPPAHLGGQSGVALAGGIVVAGVLLVGAAGGALAAAHSPATGFGGVTAFGAALFSKYLLPFEATALALLTAIVGTVALSSGHDSAAGGASEAPEAEAEGPAIDVSHAAGTAAAAVGGQKR